MTEGMRMLFKLLGVLITLMEARKIKSYRHTFLVCHRDTGDILMTKEDKPSLKFHSVPILFTILMNS